MVTGIEIAGIVLASFPLVINGLHCGSLKAKDLWLWRKRLQRMARELYSENALFESYCRKLLEEVVEEKQMLRLMSGSGWDDPEILEKLVENMGLMVAKSFTVEVTELSKCLTKLKNYLELNEDLGVEFESKSRWRPRWRNIKLVLQRKEAMDDIVTINRRIKELVEVRQPTPINARQRAPMAKFYSNIRNQAVNLHAIFQEKFQAPPFCSCKATHAVALQFENIAANKASQSLHSMRFKVIFSLDASIATRGPLLWNWREMEFEPVNSSEDTDLPSGSHRRSMNATSGYGGDIRGGQFAAAVPGRTSNSSTKANEKTIKFGIMSIKAVSPNPKKVGFVKQTPNYNARIIENLCLTLEKFNPNITSCIGMLVSKRAKCLVWPPTPPSISSYLADPISLDSLLSVGILEKNDRLRLGVHLASAVMQLHATVWLNESWGKRDILFPQCRQEAYTETGQRISIRKPVLNKPFVRYAFDSTTRHPQFRQFNAPPLPLVQCNKSLFSLGIILVELWFGKRLEDLPKYPQRRPTSDTMNNTEYETADSLLVQIQADAGEMYGSAVRRCIRGLDYTATSLDDEGFKNEVHAKVIAQLEQNWKAYSGQLMSMEVGLR